MKSPFFPWTILLAAGGLVLAAWVTGYLTTPGQSAGGDSQVQKQHDGLQPHYVTLGQLADSEAMIAKATEDLEAVTQDGQCLNWQDLSSGKPVALVFIKSGCPCNFEFEPFFHRLESVYRGAVRFFGVIDADVNAARQYATDQRVPYPVLADPDLRIVRRLKVKNGCYVVLLTTDGVVDGFWPGCSADVMRDVSQRMARLTGLEERPLDVSGMPAALTTGCPFPR